MSLSLLNSPTPFQKQTHHIKGSTRNELRHIGTEGASNKPYKLRSNSRVTLD